MHNILNSENFKISFNNEELMRRYMKVKNMKIEDEWSRVKNMKNSEEYKKYLTGFGGGVVEQLGDEIDRIEDNIKDICPEVKHVDLEIL